MNTPHDQSTVPTNPTRTPENARSEHPILELLRYALIALIIVVPIRYFVAQPYIVSGASMDDTFAHGQYIIVDRLSYYFQEPQRGDVIVFRSPLDANQNFIKRIIGVPGDTVSVVGDTVTIKNAAHPEGFTIDEPYIEHMDAASRSVSLKDDEYFVMGDNRDHSSDSRIWGALQADRITGRAFVRLFPLGDIGLFPGAYAITPPPEEVL